MVAEAAELQVEFELTDDELGVLESWTSLSSAFSDTDWVELSMHSLGLTGFPVVAGCDRSGS